MPKLTSHVLSVTCSDDSPKAKSVWKVFRYVSNKHCGVHAVRMPRVSHWVMEHLEPNKSNNYIWNTKEGCHTHSIHTHNELFLKTHHMLHQKNYIYWRQYIYIHAYIFLPTLPKSTLNTFGVTLVAVATG